MKYLTCLQHLSVQHGLWEQGLTLEVLLREKALLGEGAGLGWMWCWSVG